MKEYVKILSETRKTKGLDIAEVSRKTGIRQGVIEAIESGEFPNLPIVYLRSFIKKYATFLNLDPESYSDLMKELDVRLAKEQLEHKPLTSEGTSSIDPSDQNILSLMKFGKYKDIISDKRLVTSLMYLGIGLVILSIVYFVFFSSDSSNIDSENVNSSIESSELEGEDDGLFDYFQESDSLVLEAFALDSAWISITIDGKRNEEILMKPGTKKIWKAESFFTITSGNAGGVQLKRNGEKLEPLGARGNVVNNVKITKTEVSK